MDLNAISFWVIGILIIGYAILDGFDFGVGILSLLIKSKDENEKRIFFNSIGPVWDGNEVWLITAGGALFAAFPVVYATVFSSFYLVVMILLVALIFRAVSFEFRNKVESATWKKFWNLSFGVGSLLSVILLGAALANVMRGIPIDAEGNFTEKFYYLLNPYSITIGILATLLFTMHGAIYLAAKSESNLKTKCIKKANQFWILFIAMFVIISLWTWIELPFLFAQAFATYKIYLLLITLFLSLILIPIFLQAEKFKHAFICSSAVIAIMILITAISIYPTMVFSSLQKEFSLTIYNAASSQLTLQTILIIALIGMPIVILYSAFIHYVFRGKVKLTDESY